ncbi:MAG: hypothetical protein CL840_01740 [Crocinitomicaceae bacterium]|nr:hypothetical protein [Crocinitomicaceae bacterium]
MFKLINELPNADTSKIVMIGVSRGGINTCQALAKTNRIKLAILMYSPYNLFTNVERRPEMENVILPRFVDNYWANRESELTNRSPALWTKNISQTTPIVIFHGTDDKKSFYEEALEFKKNLESTNHSVLLETFEQGNHGLTSHWTEQLNRTKHYLTLIKNEKPIVLYKK